MAIQIQFRRGTASEWEAVNPILAQGELGIELDTDLFKIGNGVNNWNDLEYGGLRGFTGSVGFVGSIGNISVENVLYVSKSGDDVNSGTALNLSKRTIKSALSIAKNGTTIFVKSGDYTEDNPLYIPEGVAIVGDNLRTVTIRPANVTEDLFWVNNGVYLAHMTFKDHESPASAVAFPIDGSAGVIHTSPYVQNCTSMTTTGTGMRVDGAHVQGLKSMVVDAYTQYNQGGIGIHHLNRGNSQLVSVFTICCDIAFLCESGGFCSITNSNSSFGNYALKSTGVSESLYSGKVKTTASGFVFDIDNLVNRPNIGDAVKFEGDPNYYTLSTSTAVTSGNVAIQKPNYQVSSSDARNARNVILDQKSKIQVDTINFLNKTFPTLDFDQFKCSRDVGIIIDAVVDDMLFKTNYKSRLSAISYYRVSASKVIGEQRPETVAAIQFVKTKVLQLIENDSTTQGDEYDNIRDNFDSMISIISDSDGISLAPPLAFPGLNGIDSNKIYAKDILQANRSFIIEEGIAYIAANFPLLGYNRETCERDIGLIIDAVGYDLMFGSNFRSITAGRSYYRQGAAVVTESQKEATIASFTYLKTLIAGVVTDDSTITNITNARMDDIIRILDEGLVSVPSYVIPSPPGYDSGFENARDLIDANREFIKTEVIRYIRVNYPNLGYDRDICERDVGLIIDAIGYDLMFGSNFRSITAGRSYYREGAAVVTSDQKEATLGAFNFLKDQLISLVSGNLSASASVSGNMDVILNILDNGLTVVPTFIIPPPTGYDSGLQNARNLISANRNFIKEEVIKFIAVNYPEFYYNRETCERDLGLIIDAVGYDLMFGSNFRSITAGRSYYRQGAAVVTTTQKTATIAAFIFLKTKIAEVVASSQTALASTNANMDLIIDILDQGLSVIPSYVIPAPTNYASGFRNARDLIDANRAYIKAEVVGYIAEFYPVLGYNRETCERDIGLIIDALGYDLMFGSNFRSITAGRSYYRQGAAVVTADQKTATLAAFGELKNLVSDLLSEDAAAQASAESNMDLIIDILDQGLESVPSFVIPNPTGYDTGFANARTLIESNRAFIKAEVIALIETNFSSLTFDQEVCRRDIDLILDAVYYDLTYGGNLETLIAGRAYYSYGLLQIQANEKTATLAAYGYLRDLLAQVSVNFNVLEYQQAVPQIFDLQNSGSTEAADAAGDLIIGIISIINDQTEPQEVLPDLSWVAGNLVASNSSLQSDKANLQSAITVFIEENFAYVQATCLRDIDLILDAVYYDLTYGGNLETLIAGRAYYSYSSLQLPPEQKPVTIAAYTHMRSVMQFVAVNTEPAASYQTTVQRVTGVPGSVPASLAAADLVNLVISIIDTGNLGTSVAPTLSWVGSNLVTQFNNLQNQKSAVQASVGDYVDDNFFFSERACRRDIDFILDAVFYDLTYGGNLETLVAGNAYYSFSQLQIKPAEKSVTLDAYNYLKFLVENIAQNIDIEELQTLVPQVTGTAGTLQAAQTASALIEIIRSIIDDGTAPSAVPPSTAWVSSTLVNLNTTLQNQKTVVQTAVGDFVDLNFFYGPKCRRDIDFILDAVFYDMTYGGNLETLIAGRAYYSFNQLQVPENEKAATIGAYVYMKEIIVDIAQDIDIDELQSIELQVRGPAGSLTAAAVAESLIGDIIVTIDTGTAPGEITPNLDWVPSNLVDEYDKLQIAKPIVKSTVTVFIEDNFAYKRDTCRRDIGFIVDAVCYDLIYGGNSQTADAADEYFSGGVLQIPVEQREATAATFDYIRSVADECVLNENIPALNTTVSQVTNLPSGTVSEVEVVDGLFAIVSSLVRDAYSSTIVLEESVPGPITENTTVTFHQFSLITSSGHTFEWVGAGTNVNSALPYLGGVPITANQVIEENNGKVYFTGTDQQGDFRIGNDFVINRNTGTVTGRTFTKSLFAVMTPYILAIGE